MYALRNITQMNTISISFNWLKQNIIARVSLYDVCFYSNLMKVNQLHFSCTSAH